MRRYTARFQPEAWVNDYAIPVRGPVEWDASKFLSDPPTRLESTYCTKLMVKADMDGDATDTHDVLREDPAAPSSVRQWSGPFTITIRSEETP